jgi:regulator of RNase E activity RraA
MQPTDTGTQRLTSSQLDEILEFDTCAIANAVEHFRVRLRNEGFTRPGLRCMTGDCFPKLIGYAATCAVRASEPPMNGEPRYMERTDWWDAIQGVPSPRIAVVCDMDQQPGQASSVGEVHAAILRAFGCAGVITNGAVRDLPAVEKMNFPMFARGAAVSHAYAHIVELGQPVEIFGLAIRSGDLLYADCHGAVSSPAGVAGRVAEVARRNRARERRIIAVCESPDFNPEKLLEAIRHNQE